MLFRNSFSSSSLSDYGRDNKSSPTPESPCSFSRQRVRTIPVSLCQPLLSDCDGGDRILSFFNPTQAYHIPTHGGQLIFPRSKMLDILDLSPELSRRKTAADASADSDALQQEAADLVVKQRASLRTCMTLAKDRGRGGGLSLLDGRREVTVCGWRVPWAGKKRCIVTLPLKGCEDEEIVVKVSRHDPKSQVFHVGGARYFWRYVSSNELVLEKSIDSAGAGKYVVGIFYLQADRTDSRSSTIRSWCGGAMNRPTTSSGGTLVFDARGVDRYLCVATVLIALKRERQRKAAFFLTA